MPMVPMHGGAAHGDGAHRVAAGQVAGAQPITLIVLRHARRALHPFARGNWAIPAALTVMGMGSLANE